MNTRFRYTTKTRTPEEATAARLSEVENLKARIAELRAELLLTMTAPLDLTYEAQEEVKPGEPGYDELPDHFDAKRYAGTFQWN